MQVFMYQNQMGCKTRKKEDLTSLMHRLLTAGKAIPFFQVWVSSLYISLVAY